MKKLLIIGLLLGAPVSFATENPDGLLHELRMLIFQAHQTQIDSHETRILSIKDLRRCALVCKAWRSAATSNLVWEVFARAHFHNLVIPDAIKSEASILDPLAAGVFKKVVLLMTWARTTAPTHKSMIVLEQGGDTSAISSYISEVATRNYVDGKQGDTLLELTTLAQLGSNKAAQTLDRLRIDSPELDSSDEE